jgi:hypothetical protein
MQASLYNEKCKERKQQKYSSGAPKTNLSVFRVLPPKRTSIKFARCATIKKEKHFFHIFFLTVGIWLQSYTN